MLIYCKDLSIGHTIIYHNNCCVVIDNTIPRSVFSCDKYYTVGGTIILVDKSFRRCNTNYSTAFQMHWIPQKL